MPHRSLKSFFFLGIVKEGNLLLLLLRLCFVIIFWISHENNILMFSNFFRIVGSADDEKNFPRGISIGFSFVEVFLVGEKSPWDFFCCGNFSDTPKVNFVNESFEKLKIFSDFLSFSLSSEIRLDQKLEEKKIVCFSFRLREIGLRKWFHFSIHEKSTEATWSEENSSRNWRKKSKWEMTARKYFAWAEKFDEL